VPVVDQDGIVDHRRVVSFANVSFGNGEDCLSVRDGVLFIEDCSTVELASRFATPLYVMSEAQLRTNVRAFQAEFKRGWPEGRVLVMPSIKANYVLALRRILTEEGAGCDTFGPAELHAALATGVPPELISFNGSSKSPALVVRAVAAGVRATLDAPREVDLVIAAAERSGRAAQVRVRVRPDFDFAARSEFSAEGESVREISQRYKPGIPTEELAAAVQRLLSAPNVELRGAMMHAGRHTADLAVWEQMMHRFVDVLARLRAETGWEPGEIDIGGGFAVPRDPFGRADPARRDAKPAPSVADYAGTITRALRAALVRAGMSTKMQLEVEPGRAIYGNAGVHLASVTNIKRQRSPVPRTWIETDTSEVFLPDVSWEHNRWTVVAASRAEEKPRITADVVGISCGFDVIVPDAALPELRAGDLLAFLDTGAYQDANATNFNAMPRPATVLVSGHDAEVVKRAETVEDVFARDQIPSRLQPPVRA
jgi:diaminopimelate decarboxylase